MTAFDDNRPVAPVPIPAAMLAAVTVTKIGACAAEFTAFTELAAFAVVATDADANPKVLGAGNGGRRYSDSRERRKRNTKLSHINPPVAAREKTAELEACSSPS
jgi:hypothetical protein